jgi:hypothetical protein
MPGDRSRSCPATDGLDRPDHDYVALAVLLACAGSQTSGCGAGGARDRRHPRPRTGETAEEIPAAVLEELACAAEYGIDPVAMLCQVARQRERLYLSIAAQNM